MYESPSFICFLTPSRVMPCLVRLFKISLSKLELELRAPPENPKPPSPSFEVWVEKKLLPIPEDLQLIWVILLIMLMLLFMVGDEGTTYG